MSFASQIGSFVLKTNKAHDEMTQAITLELFSSVIKSTPVDSGRARGNWQTTVTAPADGQIERNDPGGTLAIAEAQAKIPPGAGQVTYLANSLPYIQRLEYGWSKQAPAGMVRINVERIDKLVKAQAAKNKV